jgi:hypothetical protein
VTLNVSERSVRDAAKVQRDGTAALNQAVVDGTLSVSDAARVASESPGVQDQAVKAVQAGEASTAAEAVRTGQPREQEGEPPDRGDAYEGPLDPPSPLCDRCQRIGPVRDCALCEKLRRRKPKPRRDRPTRNGAVVFDWKAYMAHYGGLMRQVDVLGNAFGCKESLEARGLRRLLHEWHVRFKKLYTAKSKRKAPED